MFLNEAFIRFVNPVVTESSFPTGDVVFERLVVHTSVSSINGSQPKDRPLFPALWPV